jgi:selenide, water dikinase
MPPVIDNNVLVGLTTADDAAVYKVTEDIAVVLTVDYFTPIVDDPYDFGRVAACNALSDAYAMGAAPVIALNLVGFPTKTVPLTVLEEILRGGSDVASSAGVSVVGGHSIDDPEPKYGMVVLGFVNPGKILSNATAKAGDVLFLTKPLGTGIIATAIKNVVASPELIQRAVDLMTTLNRSASEVVQRIGVHSCTDVTGFGLLGHLHEMVTASGAGAVIDLPRVPIIEGVRELLAQNMAPGGTYRNLEFLENCGAVQWAPEITDEEKLLLCDAQTSGGLLISVPEDRADAMRQELAKTGVPCVARVGRVVEDPDHRILVGG